MYQQTGSNPSNVARLFHGGAREEHTHIEFYSCVSRGKGAFSRTGSIKGTAVPSCAHAAPTRWCGHRANHAVWSACEWHGWRHGRGKEEGDHDPSPLLPLLRPPPHSRDHRRTRAAHATSGKRSLATPHRPAPPPLHRYPLHRAPCRRPAPTQVARPAATRIPPPRRCRKTTMQS